MPFVFAEEEQAWPEDGSDPPPPKLAQFQYLTAPDMGGAREPVRFEAPTSSAPHTAAPRLRRGWLDRLLGRDTGVVHQHQQWEERTRQVRAILFEAFRDLGARQAYCRYDGGNDEGFTWLDHLELRDGARLDVAGIIERLQANGTVAALRAISPDVISRFRPDGSQLHDDVRHALAEDWATRLLGQGYGTGPFSMYGAFIVDLDACTISDDPNAEAIVENIEIDRGGT